MSEVHLSTKNLSYTYPDGTHALKNINMEIYKGQKVAIMGPNGAGKSTLFSHFNGLTEPTSGHIEIDGKAIKYEIAKLESKLENATDWEKVEIEERIGGLNFAKECLNEAWQRRKEVTE